MDIPMHQSAEMAVVGQTEHKRLRLRSVRTLYPLRQHTSRVHQGHCAWRALTAFVLPVHSPGAGDAPSQGRARWNTLCRLLTLLCETVVPLLIGRHRFLWTLPGPSPEIPEPRCERGDGGGLRGRGKRGTLFPRERPHGIRLLRFRDGECP